MSRQNIGQMILWLTPALCLISAPRLLAQDFVVNELIVLIAGGENMPSAEEVVDTIVTKSQPYLCGLDAGNPEDARLAIQRRSRGHTKQWIDDHPDSPLARLERYIVVMYPDGTDLDAIMAQLDAEPHIENVEKNYLFELSATPSDPLFGTPSSPPADSQWGTHLLNLPAAWDVAKGHAYVGMIDVGLDVDHPDLRPFHREGDGTLVYDGGNFREHLSFDFRHNDCNVDERDPQDNRNSTSAGHGTHVAGIVGATTDNGQGVAGACWNCSLLMAKAFPEERGPQSTEDERFRATIRRVAASLNFLMTHGVQVVSMSFGLKTLTCSDLDLDIVCSVLAIAEERDLLFAASSGNDKAPVEFPAKDSRVIAVGGIEVDRQSAQGFAFWDEAPFCPGFFCPDHPETCECGSNFGPEQELVAPSRQVLSSMYVGFDHSPTIGCGDSFLLPDGDGFGPCTGTSMSAPYIAGILGLLRSINPLLPREEIRDALTSTASRASNRNNQLGFGVPDATAAARRVMGQAGSRTLRNRLTPLFSLYSPEAQTHAYSTFPQVATALFFDPDEFFRTVGPSVAEYSQFPGAACQISPCDSQPKASVHLFVTDAPPYPGAPPLVPLFRLRYDPNLTNRCASPRPPRISNRDFAYTTEPAGIVHFKENVVDSNGIGYELDGIEGYLFELCENEPSCIPAGAERLYRFYHAGRDDWAIFPERELAQKQAEGYAAPSTLFPWLGYVYPNVDSDGDDLVDGFEGLIGTNPNLADTDCDGMGDGAEILRYDRSSPNPNQHGYRDPLDGPCIQIFSDGFENGQLSKWSGAVP